MIEFTEITINFITDKFLKYNMLEETCLLYLSFLILACSTYIHAYAAWYKSIKWYMNEGMHIDTILLTNVTM